MIRSCSLNSEVYKRNPVLSFFMSPSCTHIRVPSAMHSGSLHYPPHMTLYKWMGPHHEAGNTEGFCSDTNPLNYVFMSELGTIKNQQ